MSKIKTVGATSPASVDLDQGQHRILLTKIAILESTDMKIPSDNTLKRSMLSPPGGQGLLPIVAIGASAGGIEAILTLLEDLPVDLPAIVLIAVHRSPAEPSFLPQVISRHSPIFVHLARDEMALDRPICVVAPPDKHMTITPQSKIHLVADGYYRASNIDLLFHSLARSAGSRTIGVILSGALRDGTEGLRAIKEAGGKALVQSPSEAKFPDMPRSAIASDGPVDFVGTIAALAQEICRIVEEVHTKMPGSSHSNCKRMR